MMDLSQFDFSVEILGMCRSKIWTPLPQELLEGKEERIFKKK